METITTLQDQLSQLSIDQLYALIPALRSNFYSFPDKSSVYEISGLTRSNTVISIHLADSVLGIDHISLPLADAPQKMNEDLENAINKIL